MVAGRGGETAWADLWRPTLRCGAWPPAPAAIAAAERRAAVVGLRHRPRRRCPSLSTGRRSGWSRRIRRRTLRTGRRSGSSRRIRRRTLRTGRRSGSSRRIRRRTLRTGRRSGSSRRIRRRILRTGELPPAAVTAAKRCTAVVGIRPRTRSRHPSLSTGRRSGWSRRIRRRSISTGRQSGWSRRTRRRSIRTGARPPAAIAAAKRRTAVVGIRPRHRRRSFSAGLRSGWSRLFRRRSLSTGRRSGWSRRIRRRSIRTGARPPAAVSAAKRRTAVVGGRPRHRRRSPSLSIGRRSGWSRRIRRRTLRTGCRSGWSRRIRRCSLRTGARPPAAVAAAKRRTAVVGAAPATATAAAAAAAAAVLVIGTAGATVLIVGATGVALAADASAPVAAVAASGAWRQHLLPQQKGLQQWGMSPASVAAVGGAAVATTTSMLFFAVAGAAGLCAAAAIATGRAATAAAAAATQMTNKISNDGKFHLKTSRTLYSRWSKLLLTMIILYGQSSYGMIYLFNTTIYLHYNIPRLEAREYLNRRSFFQKKLIRKVRGKAGVPVFFADLCEHPIHLLVQRSTFPLRRLLLELDIQAFGDSGVLLYEMLYGYTLFGGIPHKGSAVRNCQQAGLIKHLCKEGKSYVFLIILEYRSELRPQDIVQPRTIPA